MALSAKSEALKHVPWFSLSEWHQAYQQIYSNDILEQTKAYQTLLIWKARIPKLPVGVESTLSIIQVCLRDRQWTPKIDKAELPMYYQNDLCLMYSTTIMRFLNQISNIGHTKQTSMFQIARQLKIPDWIVNLRHDTAHGHELPPIGTLRIAANILLTWLHEEYWAAETKAIEERYGESSENIETEKSCDSHAFIVFFELWTAVGLYSKADYKTVRHLPDPELRDTLLNLCTILPENPLQKEQTYRNSQNVANYLLTDAQSILLSEITTLLSKNKPIPNMEEIVVRVLFDCEAFLSGPEIIGIFIPKDETVTDMEIKDLPSGMTEFWQKFIVLIHDKKLLDELMWRLFEFVNSPNEDMKKRFVASLWIKSICNSLLKLRIAQSVKQEIEHSLDDKRKQMSSKQIIQKVHEIVNESNPRLSNAMWLNISSEIPLFLQDLNFVTDLLLDANLFTKNFIQPILDLVAPSISLKYKDHLLKLVNIHTRGEHRKVIDGANNGNRMYSVEDLIEICGETEEHELKKNGICQSSVESELADRTIRNEVWEVASADYDWADCPYGILPWQIESLEMLEYAESLQPRPVTLSKESDIVPGILDEKLLTAESRVNWDNVLRKKKRLKRKRQHGESEIMIDRAIEMVKKRQK